jgi:predicted  nucleic acid-binding Zn-ribbon protein
MNIFRREKSSSELAGGIAPIYAPSTALTGKMATSDDISQARESVEFIVGELKASADQQQMSAKRMVALNKTIAKMESGLRHVTRLEAQNLRLGNDLQGVKKKLEQKTSWASEQENKLVNLERQHNDMRQQFENAKADIAQRTDREVGDREKLIKQSRDIETLSGQLGQKDERISTLEMSNQNLQDETALQAGSLSSQNHRVMELQKSTEELSTRLDAKTKASDVSTVELKNLRLDFNEMKAKFFEASGGLENAKYDLKTQKNVYEDTLKRRDDKALALKSRIEQLNTQVRIKDNMSKHFDEEIVTLRNGLETERERNDRNETRFRGKADEVERNARALARAKVEYENLNAKFTAAVEDLDTLRKINMVQKQKLERYAAIGGVTVGQSMIASDAARSSLAGHASKKRDGGGNPLL